MACAMIAQHLDLRGLLDACRAIPLQLGQKQIREIVYVQFTHGMVRLRLDTSVIDWHPERHEVKDPTGMRVKLVGILLLVIDHFLPGIPAVSHPLDVDLPRLLTIADQHVSWLRLPLAVHALLAERLELAFPVARAAVST